MPPQVTVDVPSTCGNFGPGFDVMSLAFAAPGERVTVAPADQDRITITGVGADTVPSTWDQNVAGVAVDHIRKTMDHNEPVAISLEKKAPPCSGLGSSASSAAGAVLGYLALHAKELDRTRASDPTHAIEAAAAGQAVASGLHHDDPAAAVLGGLAIVFHDLDRRHYQRLEPPRPFHAGLVTPDLALATSEMRAAIPDTLPLSDAVQNLGGTAHLLACLQQGDVPGLLNALGMDRISRPHRLPHLPSHESLLAAADEAGVEAVLLCGSGPTLAACSTDPDRARQGAEALADAFAVEGLDATTTLTEPDRRRVYDDVVLSRL